MNCFGKIKFQKPFAKGTGYLQREKNKGLWLDKFIKDLQRFGQP